MFRTLVAGVGLVAAAAAMEIITAPNLALFYENGFQLDLVLIVLTILCTWYLVLIRGGLYLIYEALAPMVRKWRADRFRDKLLAPNVRTLRHG